MSRACVLVVFLAFVLVLVPEPSSAQVPINETDVLLAEAICAQIIPGADVSRRWPQDSQCYSFCNNMLEACVSNERIIILYV